MCVVKQVRLEKEFTIKTVAGVASKWVVEGMPKKIRCDQLLDKLEEGLEVYAVDENGNRTEFETSPFLCLEETAPLTEGMKNVEFCTDGKERTDSAVVEVKLERVRDENDDGSAYSLFMLPEKTVMTGSAQNVNISLRNATGVGVTQLAVPAPVVVKLVAGEKPDSIQLQSLVVQFKESGTERMEDGSYKYAVAVQPKLKWPDLKATVFDTWLNVMKGYAGSAKITAEGCSQPRNGNKVRFKNGVAAFTALELVANEIGGESTSKYKLTIETEGSNVKAVIECIVKLSNKVVSFEAKEGFENMTAGEACSNVEYTLATQDSSMISPPENFTRAQFTFKLVGPNKREIPINTAVDITNEDRQRGGAVIKAVVSLSMESDGAGEPVPLAFDKTGKYKLVCVFRDERLGSESTHKDTMEIDVRPGDPVKIVLTGKTGKINASNGAEKGARLILKNATIVAHDSRGNVTGLNEIVTAQLHCVAPMGGPAPQLEGATKGRIQERPDRSKATPNVRFGPIMIEQGSGSADGTCILRFEAAQLQPAEVQVEFSTDSKRTEQLQKLEAQLRELKEQEEELNARQKEKETEKETIEDQAKELTRKIKRSHRQLSHRQPPPTAFPADLGPEEILSDEKAERVNVAYHELKKAMERDIGGGRAAVVDPSSNPAIARNYGSVCNLQTDSPRPCPHDESASG